jgi:hypothetical protein
MTAADYSAIAECVGAATVLVAAISWALNRTRPLGIWFQDRLRKALNPTRVSMEVGVAYARKAARSGHPPVTVTDGGPDPEQPIEYLLAKTAESVWQVVSAGHSEHGLNLDPVRNYMTALAAKAGLSPARDFALGVLTERVRQEEDGWPDHPGDHSGLRTGHGTGTGHLCLLQRKHDVEDAIYGIGIVAVSAGAPTEQVRRE